ncbi:MAG TPA: TM1812 family CRISPR-associated protein, partial [Candidatus Goldiibacteriota bacterium]|nr:TM1812 family CRISPR-associated protein [Candidatus Goldiibacteriota bacterium]
MAKTLISFIGTGIRFDNNNEKNVYRKVSYSGFGFENVMESSVFVNCLMRSEVYRPDELIVIGTVTSAWEALIDEDPNQSNLYLKLWQNGETKPRRPITQEDLLELQAIVQTKHKIPVKLVCHSDDMTDNHLPEILSAYDEVAAGINEEHEVILDITHGFRSMSVLFEHVLSSRYGGNDTAKVSFIYAEIRTEKNSGGENITNGYVRNLKPVAELSKRNFAMSGFINRFNIGNLPEYINKAGWKKGADAVKKIGQIVQSNFFDQLKASVDTVSEVLNDDSYPKNPPAWLNRIKREFEKITDVNSNKKWMVNLGFSEVLAKKKLFGAAILCLQCAVEQKLKNDFLKKHPEHEKAIKNSYTDYQKLVLRPFYDGKNCPDGISRLNVIRNHVGHYGMERRGVVPEPYD